MQVTLELMSNQNLPGLGEEAALQLWRGATNLPMKQEGKTENAQPYKKGPLYYTLWAASAKPASTVTQPPAAAALTLKLLPCSIHSHFQEPHFFEKDENKEAERQTGTRKQMEGVGEGKARPGLLDGYKAAIWVSEAPISGAPPNKEAFALLRELTGHQGPPPCFVYSVHILESHLKEALKELHPSVSAQDLRRYERMREQYAAGNTD